MQFPVGIGKAKTKMKRNGFTIIEALIAMVLIGLAIVSLVGANIVLTRANGVGVTLTTAEFLIEQIKELTTMLPVIDPQTETDVFGAEEGAIANYDDIDDFDGQTFSPPINSRREVLNNFAAYSQQVTVENLNATNFAQVVGDHSSSFVRVTVKVFLNSELISSTNWIRVHY